MSNYLQSNTKFYLKDVLAQSTGALGTFRISSDLELGTPIETGAEYAFVVLKNGTQIERMLLGMTGGVATIIERGLQQDGITPDVSLQKTWGDGTIGYITPNPQDFPATGKLDKVGGLRTGMTANGFMTTNGSGDEATSILSADPTLDPTDTIMKKNAGGNWELTPYSAFQADIVSGSAQANVAGEALILNDLCVYEYMLSSAGPAISGVGKYFNQKMGDVAGNTRISMKLAGNGISTTQCFVILSKTGSPTDNVLVRIETDDGTGKPSGTLANANAVGTIVGSGLTTTLTKTTVTFLGAFILSDRTLYHLVIQRSTAVDGSNNYNIGACSKNSRMLKVNNYNGTAWQTEVSTKTLYFICIGVYNRYIVKSITSTTEHNWVDGVAQAATAQLGVVNLIRDGIASGFSGLTDGQPYYISAVAGIPTLTGSATAREVGYAVGTTKMYIKNPLFNGSNYETASADNIIYMYNESAVNNSTLVNTFRMQERCKIFVGMTFSGGSGTLAIYADDTTLFSGAGGAAASYTIYPGQLITIVFVPSVGNYGRVIGFQNLTIPFGHIE